MSCRSRSWPTGPVPRRAAALDRLVASIATDCFLTAQAIGHVRPGIPGDGETLAAHRLARARSEAVQAALVRGGLPAGVGRQRLGLSVHRARAARDLVDLPAARRATSARARPCRARRPRRRGRTCRPLCRSPSPRESSSRRRVSICPLPPAREPAGAAASAPGSRRGCACRRASCHARPPVPAAGRRCRPGWRPCRSPAPRRPRQRHPQRR